MGFYILFFEEEVLFLNYLNRVIWFIVILYMYYFDENINKLYNFNIVIRLNVLYELFFFNWLNCVYIYVVFYRNIYRIWLRI